jgi:hypothetical protein
MKKLKYSIGEVVRHDFSLEEGTITNIRDDEYSVYVEWNTSTSRNDWYKPDVLVLVRGAVSSDGKPALTLADLNDGVIGLSNPPEESI